MSQQLFTRLGRIHQYFLRSLWLTSPIHYVLEFWTPVKAEGDLSWNEQAELAMLDEAPMRARKILYWMAGVLLAMLAWSAFTKVDEVTRGEGRVIPSKQVQVIQSLDGGIVSKILVHEGQTVMVGDPLIQIDQTRANSSLQENQSQYISLLARQSRLQALSEGKPFNPPPEAQGKNPEVYAQEYSLYVSSNDALDSQVSMARDVVTQRERELAETRSRLDSAQRGLDLATRELAVTKPLLKSGAVSEVDLLRLERDVSKLSGDRDQAQAQIGRVQAAISEASRKIYETKQTFLSKVRADLAETTAKLNGLGATSLALSDKVKQSTLKSPVNGTVSRLFANTVGGVIEPGKQVLEVVPSDDALVLETRIQPKDIAFINLDQPANVKLTAYDYTIYGTLQAKVVGVAANSIVDDKGNAFYIVRIRTLKPNLGKGLPIIPGMVAQVDIITGKKSVLSYLLKPVLKAKSYAFTER